VFPCSPVGVWIIIWAGPSVRANTGAWIESRRIIAKVIVAIFAMSCFLGFICGYFMSLPQWGQKSSFWFWVGLHFWHGWRGCGFRNMLVLNSFSVVVRSSSVPRNMSIHPPRKWKIWRASCSPYW